MSADNLRTRRQLRASYGHATRERNDAEHRVQDRDATIEQLSFELRDAEQALQKAGFEWRKGQPRALKTGSYHQIDWSRPGPDLVASQGTLDAAVGEARTRTRSETLQAVIDALQLREYGYRFPKRSDGLSFYAILSDSIDGPERLWADIQTAIQVRAEKTAAEERAKTAGKVAGLRNQAPSPILGFDSASGVSVFGSIHDDGRIHIDRFAEPVFNTAPMKPAAEQAAVTQEDIEKVATIADQLGVKGDLESFAETVSKLAGSSYGTAAPSKPKKSAKKKSEGKK